MKELSDEFNYNSQSGLAAITLILIFLIILSLIFGFNFGYIYYLEECGDLPVKTCLTDSGQEANDRLDDSEEEIIPVVATGSASYKGYSANISLYFPLDGGSVTGSVEGDCSGTLNGVYSGENNGAISGKIFGSCSPFFVPIPAKAEFSGSVNQESKTVLITVSGSAAGFSASEPVTLTY